MTIFYVYSEGMRFFQLKHKQMHIVFIADKQVYQIATEYHKYAYLVACEYGGGGRGEYNLYKPFGVYVHVCNHLYIPFFTVFICIIMIKVKIM